MLEQAEICFSFFHYSFNTISIKKKKKYENAIVKMLNRSRTPWYTLNSKHVCFTRWYIFLLYSFDLTRAFIILLLFDF